MTFRTPSRLAHSLGLLSTGLMLVSFVLLSLAMLSACGSGTGPAGATISGDDQGQVRAATIVAAVAATADATNADAYPVAFASSESLDAASVVVCLSTATKCRAGEGTRVTTRLSETPSRRIHIATESVKISNGLVLTVMGRTTGGVDVAQQFRFEAADGTAVPSACHKAPDDLTCDIEKHIVRLTNEFRQSQGRSVLTHDQKVSYVSRLWSTEQARRGSIGHDWFSNGRWRQEYIKEFDETPRMGGENVAMSGGGGSNAEAIAKIFVNMWINSSGHRANMVGNHKAMGAGVARRGNAWYATQNFGG